MFDKPEYSTPQAGVRQVWTGMPPADPTRHMTVTGLSEAAASRVQIRQVPTFAQERLPRDRYTDIGKAA